MTNTNPQAYRFLPLFSMLYITLMLSVAVLSNNIISIGQGITMAGTLIVPFWFGLSDIITEIYGYKIAKRIVWMAFFCHFIFSFLCQIALLFPHPAFWHGQAGFQEVLGPLLRNTISGFIAYIVSISFNIYLISKWKILLKGKYFWLRSIGASTIGELFFTILAVFMIQYHILPFDQIIRIIITSYSIKVVCSLISAFPANFVVSALKNIEVLPDTNPRFNPFKKDVAL